MLTLNFVLIRTAPGDPILYLISGIGQEASPELVAGLRHQYGLDRPLIEQYFVFIYNALHGDFGYSYFKHASVLSLVMLKLPNTLLLMLGSFFISTIVGIWLGIYASRKPHSLSDNVAQIFALAGYATPEFWNAMNMILIFAVYLGVLPSMGMFEPETSGWGRILSTLEHAILPMSVLAINHIALYTRVTRASMLE